jgi:cytochrome c oxidase subunit 2
MSRRKIAAGMLDNTPANLLAWIEHAQQIKLGSRMPDFSFTNEQQQQLMAYLEQLQ